MSRHRASWAFNRMLGVQFGLHITRGRFARASAVWSFAYQPHVHKHLSSSSLLVTYAPGFGAILIVTRFFSDQFVCVRRVWTKYVCVCFCSIGFSAAYRTYGLCCNVPNRLHHYRAGKSIKQTEREREKKTRFVYTISSKEKHNQTHVVNAI